MMKYRRLRPLVSVCATMVAIQGCSTTDADRTSPSSPPGVCSGEHPEIPDVDTGIFSCDEGFRHRKYAGACAPHESFGLGGEGNRVQGDSRNQCTTDSDCDPGLACRILYAGGMGTWTVCASYCDEDSDCQSGSICDCRREQCIEARCKSDADCDGGFCISTQNVLGVEIEDAGFVCQSPNDECFAQDDCSQLQPVDNKIPYCAVVPGQPRACKLSQGSVF